MCLLVFAWRTHPRYPLIVAGNRDEFHARPAKPAHWWPDLDGVLGGRDLRAGGTWLAVHKNGRLATVTNYRDRVREPGRPKSRGRLVTGFLATGESPADYLANIDGTSYGGFNLVVADGESLCYMNNRGDGPTALEPGIHGVSNLSLDTPWHKVEKSKAALRRLIDGDRVNETSLLGLLGDRERAPAGEVSADGLTFSQAHALSAPFVVSPDYGTRCSSVVVMQHDGKVSFTERRYSADGSPAGDSRYSFLSA